jgi:hypothetical protein
MLVVHKIFDYIFNVEYHWVLNGYSLIPSWWRDRPYETQQPAVEEMTSGRFIL